MGCNCGQKSSTVTKYYYTAPNGQVKEYSNEVEARAQQIRAGGVGTVTRK